MKQKSVLQVSVVIITKDEEHTIRPCMDSLCAIDYSSRAVEIIVADCSADSTPGIVQEYARRSRRRHMPTVRLLRCRRCGFAAQRNAGMQAARHDTILFTDADCVVPKDWIRTLVSGFKEKGVAAVAGNAYPPPDSPWLGKCIACLGFPAGGSIGLDANVKINNHRSEGFATCNVALSKASVNHVGGFDETTTHGGEDTDLARRLRTAGYTIWYEPESFVYHTTRDSVRSLLRWSWRRGEAMHTVNRKKSRFAIISLALFPLIVAAALVWLTALIIILNSHVGSGLLFLLISLLALLWLPLLGVRKMRMVVQRRHRTGLGFLSVIVVVPILFYMRQLVIRTVLFLRALR